MEKTQPDSKFTVKKSDIRRKFLDEVLDLYSDQFTSDEIKTLKKIAIHKVYFVATEIVGYCELDAPAGTHHARSKLYDIITVFNCLLTKKEMIQQRFKEHLAKTKNAKEKAITVVQSIWNRTKCKMTKVRREGIAKGNWFWYKCEETGILRKLKLSGNNVREIAC